jgi:hypothetical protein
VALSIPAELAAAIPLIDRFQVEAFLRLMQKQIQSAGKRGFFYSKKSSGSNVRERFTFEDMLCFQKVFLSPPFFPIDNPLTEYVSLPFLPSGSNPHISPQD